MNFFGKLKDKWQVGWFQFVLIFTTFALGGSLCAKAGSWLLSFWVTEQSFIYWIFYVPLVTILWPLSVLIVSIPFGQLSFFSKYLHKIGVKLGLTKA